MAHAVDLLVDGAILLDIGVGARDVSLGLVVVVKGDKILDRVVREEALELAIELRGQRLVGGENQGRALGLLDDVGHGEGLARAGDAEQDLVALACVHLSHKLGDGGGLIALRHKFGLEIQRDPAFRLLGPGRPVGREVGNVPGDQGVFLDQRLWRVAKAGRAPVAAKRHAAVFAGNGARLGARAKGLGDIICHCRNMAAGRGLG